MERSCQKYTQFRQTSFPTSQLCRGGTRKQFEERGRTHQMRTDVVFDALVVEQRKPGATKEVVALNAAAYVVGVVSSFGPDRVVVSHVGALARVAYTFEEYKM